MKKLRPPIQRAEVRDTTLEDKRSVKFNFNILTLLTDENAKLFDFILKEEKTLSSDYRRGKEFLLHLSFLRNAVKEGETKAEYYTAKMFEDSEWKKPIRLYDVRSHVKLYTILDDGITDEKTMDVDYNALSALLEGLSSTHYADLVVEIVYDTKDAIEAIEGLYDTTSLNQSGLIEMLDYVQISPQFFTSTEESDECSLEFLYYI